MFTYTVFSLFLIEIILFHFCFKMVMQDAEVSDAGVH